MYGKNKDIIIFDGNSKKAHLIVREIMLKQKGKIFDFIPKQNTRFFGLPTKLKIGFKVPNEEICVITKHGKIVNGAESLNYIYNKLDNMPTFH